MLAIYLKLAFRNLRKQRLYSSVSILGLSLGFYCFLLLGFYVSSEQNYDGFHGQVFRLLQHIREEGKAERTVAATGPQLGIQASLQLPEIERSTRLAVLGRLTVGNDPANRFYERITVIDSNFFSLFNFPILQGSQEALFSQPDAFLLPQTIAHKYFGQEPAVGKGLYTNVVEGEVVAVMEDFPKNTHLGGELILPAQTAAAALPWWSQFNTTNWHRNFYNTYFRLREDASPEAVAAKITALAKANWPEELPFNSTFSLQPISDIHLSAEAVEGELNEGKGNAFYVKVFSWLALVLLLVAAVNFAGQLNVSFLARAQEMGVRKAVGAGRRQLLAQVAVESLVVIVLSLLLALMAMQLTMPYTESLLGKSYSWGLLQEKHIALLAGIALAAVLAVVVYPSWLISRWQPAEALKGERAVAGRQWTVRQGLTFLQFAVAVALIACTIVFYRQLQFIQNKELGFDMDGVIVVDINSSELRHQFEAIKAEFVGLPEVSSVSVSSRVPGEWKAFPLVSARLPEEALAQSRELVFIGADEDFLNTYQAGLLKGQNFSGKPSDSTRVLLNEAAVLAFGLDEPVGQWLEISSVNWGGDNNPLEEPHRLQVAGVVKDYHFEDVHLPIRPMVMGFRNNPIHNIDYYSLRTSTSDWEGTLSTLKEINRRFDQANPLEYTILTDQFNRFFEEDILRSRLLGFFSAVAILIACLGLFVVVAYSLRQRTKEIGIRKVLGASVGGIVGLIARDFLRVVGLAAAVGLPLAWLAMHSWLEEFAYRISLAWWVFGLAAIAALLIALLTISLQSLRAATANPVEALRYE